MNLHAISKKASDYYQQIQQRRSEQGQDEEREKEQATFILELVAPPGKTTMEYFRCLRLCRNAAKLLHPKTRVDLRLRLPSSEQRVSKNASCEMLNIAVKLQIFVNMRKIIVLGDSVAKGLGEIMQELVGIPFIDVRAKGGDLARNLWKQAFTKISQSGTNKWHEDIHLAESFLIVVAVGNNDDKYGDVIFNDMLPFFELCNFAQKPPHIKVLVYSPTRREEIGQEDRFVDAMAMHMSTDLQYTDFSSLSRQRVGLSYEDFDDNLHPNDSGYIKMIHTLINDASN